MGQVTRLAKFGLFAIYASMITPTHSLMQLKQNWCLHLVRNKLSSGVEFLHNMHSMFPKWITNKKVSLCHVCRFLEGHNFYKKTTWLTFGKVGRGGGDSKLVAKTLRPVIHYFICQVQLDQLWLAMEQWWSWVPDSQQHLTMLPHHKL